MYEIVPEGSAGPSPGRTETTTGEQKIPEDGEGKDAASEESVVRQTGRVGFLGLAPIELDFSEERAVLDIAMVRAAARIEEIGAARQRELSALYSAASKGSGNSAVGESGPDSARSLEEVRADLERESAALRARMDADAAEHRRQVEKEAEVLRASVEREVEELRAARRREALRELESEMTEVAQLARSVSAVERSTLEDEVQQLRRWASSEKVKAENDLSRVRDQLQRELAHFDALREEARKRAEEDVAEERRAQQERLRILREEALRAELEGQRAHSEEVASRRRVEELVRLRDALALEVSREEKQAAALEDAVAAAEARRRAAEAAAREAQTQARSAEAVGVQVTAALEARQRELAQVDEELRNRQRALDSVRRDLTTLDSEHARVWTEVERLAKTSGPLPREEPRPTPKPRTADQTLRFHMREARRSQQAASFAHSVQWAFRDVLGRRARAAELEQSRLRAALESERAELLRARQALETAQSEAGARVREEERNRATSAASRAPNPLVIPSPESGSTPVHSPATPPSAPLSALGTATAVPEHNSLRSDLSPVGAGPTVVALDASVRTSVEKDSRASKDPRRVSAASNRETEDPEALALQQRALDAERRLVEELVSAGAVTGRTPVVERSAPESGRGFPSHATANLLSVGGRPPESVEFVYADTQVRSPAGSRGRLPDLASASSDRAVWRVRSTGVGDALEIRGSPSTAASFIPLRSRALSRFGDAPRLSLAPERSLESGEAGQPSRTSERDEVTMEVTAGSPNPANSTGVPRPSEVAAGVVPVAPEPDAALTAAAREAVTILRQLTEQLKESASPRHAPPSNPRRATRARAIGVESRSESRGSSRSRTSRRTASEEGSYSGSDTEGSVEEDGTDGSVRSDSASSDGEDREDEEARSGDESGTECSDSDSEDGRQQRRRRKRRASSPVSDIVRMYASRASNDSRPVPGRPRADESTRSEVASFVRDADSSTALPRSPETRARLSSTRQALSFQRDESIAAMRAVLEVNTGLLAHTDAMPAEEWSRDKRRSRALLPADLRVPPALRALRPRDRAAKHIERGSELGSSLSSVRSDRSHDIGEHLHSSLTATRRIVVEEVRRSRESLQSTSPRGRTQPRVVSAAALFREQKRREAAARERSASRDKPIHRELVAERMFGHRFGSRSSTPRSTASTTSPAPSAEVAPVHSAAVGWDLEPVYPEALRSEAEAPHRARWTVGSGTVGSPSGSRALVEVASLSSGSLAPMRRDTWKVRSVQGIEMHHR